MGPNSITLGMNGWANYFNWQLQKQNLTTIFRYHCPGERNGSKAMWIQKRFGTANLFIGDKQPANNHQTRKKVGILHNKQTHSWLKLKREKDVPTIYPRTRTPLGLPHRNPFPFPTSQLHERWHRKVWLPRKMRNANCILLNIQYARLSLAFGSF